MTQSLSKQLKKEQLYYILKILTISASVFLSCTDVATISSYKPVGNWVSNLEISLPPMQSLLIVVRSLVYS